MKTDKIMNLITLEGENQRVEFKEKLNNLDREVVAFANAVGGSIYLGIADDGKLIGIDITNRLKSQIVDISRNCDPGINIKLLEHHHNNLLEIQVQEGKDKPYRCKDGFFLRIGPSTQKLKRDEIVNLINDSDKIHFDESINNRFIYPKDFATNKLKDFLKRCGLDTTLSIKDILINLNVAIEEKKTLSFTNAGVLFFANNPQQFLPESSITAVRYKTSDRFSIIDKKDFTGSLIQQIENSIDFIVRHMNVSVKITSTQVARQEVYDYPIVALREAIVNAVTHRDYYYDSSHIYIHMYSNHIDMENPGGLLQGISIENLGKRSARRNRLIADLLHRVKFIERVGSGFDRMQHSLAKNNNPPLEISATNFFNIRFYQRIPNINLSHLTRRQTTIYQLIQERQTIRKNEIANALNISGDTALRDLNTLVKQGLIIKSGTGKSTVYKSR